MDKFYITDGSGMNICNNNVYDINYNHYNYLKFFRRACLYTDGLFQTITNGSSDNNGRLVVFKFGENQNYDNVYNGGYSFKDGGDYYFNFTSRGGSNNLPMVLFAIFLVPAMLELENGNLEEYYN